MFLFSLIGCEFYVVVSLIEYVACFSCVLYTVSVECIAQINGFGLQITPPCCAPEIPSLFQQIVLNSAVSTFFCDDSECLD